MARAFGASGEQAEDFGTFVDPADRGNNGGDDHFGGAGGFGGECSGDCRSAPRGRTGWLYRAGLCAAVYSARFEWCGDWRGIWACCGLAFAVGLAFAFAFALDLAFAVGLTLVFTLAFFFTAAFLAGAFLALDLIFAWAFAFALFFSFSPVRISGSRV